MRASWPFDNPNVLGAFCACAAVCAAVFMAACRQTEAPRWRSAAASLVLVAGAGGLALSGSRGGWVAFSAGMLVAAFILGRQGKLWLAVVAGCVLVACVAIPAGTSRVAESFAAGGDRSVLTRIEIWKAAAYVSSQAPTDGVGAGRFGAVYRAWFQPEALTGQFTGAISDHLTIAAEHGILVFFGWLAVAMFPVVECIRRARSGGSAFWAVGASSLAAWLVAGSFSTLSLEPAAAAAFLVNAGAVTAALVCASTWRQLAVGLAASAVLSFVASAVVVGAGAVQAATNASPMPTISVGPGVTTTRIEPPRATSTAVVLSERGATPPDLGRKLCRPWARTGVRIVAVEAVSGESAEGAVGAALRGLDGRVCIVGVGNAALWAARIRPTILGSACVVMIGGPTGSFVARHGVPDAVATAWLFVVDGADWTYRDAEQAAAESGHAIVVADPYAGLQFTDGTRAAIDAWLSSASAR